MFQDGKFRISLVGTGKNALAHIKVTCRWTHVRGAFPWTALSGAVFSWSKQILVRPKSQPQGVWRLESFTRICLCAKPSLRITSQKYRQKILATFNVLTCWNNFQVNIEDRNAYANAIEGTFNPLLKVLCTFPLWYLSAIGFGKLISFARSLPCHSHSSPKEHNSAIMECALVSARVEKGFHLLFHQFQ